MNFVMATDIQANIPVNFFYKSGLDWLPSKSLNGTINNKIYCETDIGKLKAVGENFQCLLTSQGWIYS